MSAGVFIVATLLSLPAVSPRPDTIQAPDSVAVEATSAPTNSSTPWDLGLGRLDPRLLPGTISLAPGDTQPRRRRRAVEYSDWYYRRLQIHRWGSWIELPLFAGEYWLGNKLISKSRTPESWVKPTHETVAYTLGGLFTVNTVTGLWNLWDSRNSADDRALIWSHSALMLASDAGFAITGLIAEDAGRTNSGGNRHRAAALASIGLASAGTLLMWVKRGL